MRPTDIQDLDRTLKFHLLVCSKVGRQRGYITHAAKLIGCNYQYLSNMLSGRTKPSAAIVAKINALPEFDRNDEDLLSSIKFRRSQEADIALIQANKRMRTWQDAAMLVINAGIKSVKADKASFPTPKSPKAPEPSAFE